MTSNHYISQVEAKTKHGQHLKMKHEDKLVKSMT